MEKYCKLRTGEELGDYIIKEKIGCGRFATVYSAIHKTGGDDAAIKIYRNGEKNNKYYTNEVQIYQRLNNIPKVLQFKGAFAHVSMPTASVHPYLIFNLEGDSLSKLLKKYRKGESGMPLYLVKDIARDLFTGLQYIHDCKLIHTDIKPGNLLLSENGISIADLGSATDQSELLSTFVGTQQYCAPEVILEQEYTSAIDIWSSMCTIYELITCDYLFDVYCDCNIEYGDDIDCELRALTGEEEDEDEERSSNDTDESDELDEDFQETNYKHLLIIEKLLGAPPKEFTALGRKYYNARGKLIYNPVIEHTPIATLLNRTYDLDETTCAEIQDFLLTGLQYNPNTRLLAKDLLSHIFIK